MSAFLQFVHFSWIMLRLSWDGALIGWKVKGAKFQIFLVALHSKRTCLTVSIHLLQLWHTGSCMHFLLQRFSAVGRMFFDAFHMKILTFSGNSRAHRVFHWLELLAELLGSSGNLSLSASWYALFTEYSPLLSRPHITSSFICLLAKGILRINSTSSAIKCCFSFSESHLFSAFNKSATTASAGKLGGDIGLKVSSLGSQLSLYIRMFLPFPIHRLIPLLSTCLLHKMFFQM